MGSPSQVSAHSFVGISLALLTVGGAGRGEGNQAIPGIVREIDARRIEASIRKLVSFGTRNTLSSQDDPKRGIGAARDWIIAEMQRYAADSGGRMRVELQSFEQPRAGRIPRPVKITNVLAWLDGTQPNPGKRLFVVSGHYDSMCGRATDGECDAPGANDDASGTAAVMEMARVMSRHQFEAPILFAAVAGEEQGLLGSRYLAEKLQNDGWRVEAMLTNDIIGSSRGGNGVKDDRSVRVFSEGVPTSESESQAAVRRSVGGENDSVSRQLARYIKEYGERSVPGMKVRMIYRRDRYGRGGDHIPFLERGFPAVRLSEPNEDYRHQHQNVRTENGIVYGDLPEFVDFPYVAKVACVNAAALASMASAPAPPRNVSVVNRQSPDTELRWVANTESDFAGYEVVWRETTEPVWTHSRAAGNVTAFTIPGLSKDNYFFGVRAVDRQGNRSIVAFPSAGRTASSGSEPERPSAPRRGPSSP